MRKFFMCPPAYFKIEYAINVWTDIRSRINLKKAMEEWEELRDIYLGLGIQLDIIPPVPEIVEQTFIGDSIFLFGEKAVPACFRHQPRNTAVPVSAAHFKSHGFEIHPLPEGVHYEGNGDSLIWNGLLLGGYGVRSDREVYDFIGPLFDIEVVPLQLMAPFYHLDLALCPINTGTLAYYPKAFTPASCETIERLASKIIRVSHEEVMNFALNCKALGDLIIMNGRPCPEFESQVRGLGLGVKKIDTSEFNKAGGAAKCITLEHYQL